MGFMDRFRPKELSFPMPTKEELHSIAEDISMRGLPAAIEASIQKAIDAGQNYQAFENSDDNGNYFGSEFNIRATAGRIKSAYSKEPWIYASASLLARLLCGVPMVIKHKVTGEIVENHPLLGKMKLGNKLEGGASLEWRENLDLVLGGNSFRAFDEHYTEAILLPVELTSLKLDRTKMEISDVQIYDNSNLGVNALIPYKQVVHIKYPNPYNIFYGLSIFTAASRPLLLDRYKNEFEMAFYLRGATNAGVIETTEDINKTRMERLMRTFEAVYTGKRNWWRTIFLPKGAKWVQSGLTMSEMQHLEGMKENRLSILAVLGIPPSQVGVVQDVNRATSETQERALWVNTIKPLAEFKAASWNNSYLVKVIFNDEYYFEPDFSQIEALQGSLQTKGEQAKSVEAYLTVNEIRKDILGYEPLPDDRGNKFVAEIRPSMPAPGAPGSTPADQTDSVSDPAAQIIDETTPLSLPEGTSARALLKAQVTASQGRIESKLTEGFLKAYETYLDAKLDLAVYALNNGKDLDKYLSSKVEELAKIYIKGVEPALKKALNRGFSFASSQSKNYSSTLLASTKRHIKATRFSDIDQQAIDALKAEEEDTQNSSLIRRGIENFVGFDTTHTREIIAIVAMGAERGFSSDKIAAEIRANYKEAYPGQANTIARTELLSAVSQGLSWNHGILEQVFSKVSKQWFHVAPDKDSREDHIEFENDGIDGVVPGDYKWGGVLDYPRDPNGDAKDIINCRCSMVSVIPNDAVSNAEFILEALP